MSVQRSCRTCGHSKCRHGRVVSSSDGTFRWVPGTIQATWGPWEEERMVCTEFEESPIIEGVL